jgi:hypothetical protein
VVVGGRGSRDGRVVIVHRVVHVRRSSCRGRIGVMGQLKIKENLIHKTRKY